MTQRCPPTLALSMTILGSYSDLGGVLKEINCLLISYAELGGNIKEI